MELPQSGGVIPAHHAHLGDVVTEQSPDDKLSMPWGLYAGILLISITIAGIMLYSMRMGIRMPEVFAPLVDACMEAKLETTVGHLWLEELISGDPDISSNDVWSHFDQAEWYVRAILSGGKNNEGVFIPLNDVTLRREVEEELKALTSFVALAKERAAVPKEAAVGSVIDQRFDAAYTDFMKQAEKVESSLQAVIAQDLRSFTFVQMVLVGSCMVLAGIIAMVLTRFVRQRHKAERLLRFRNWVSSGQSRLADVMRGELDEASLSRNVITFLSKYVGAQMASLYVASDDAGALILSGSYAFNKRKSLNERIKLGEGLAGQAALERIAISVTDVPEDYVRISSTLGASSPCNILAAPFVYEDKLAGVAEFASFTRFTDAQMTYLESVAESVAIAFSAAANRRRMQELLEQTQRQSEELEAQTEELQSQQEKLRATNVELELQSEELRVSNEELEEKTEALERQKAEIEERTHEVERAKLEVEGKARELELASKYKSEFLANMSHELRTPLNSLLILAKVLSDNTEGNLTDGQVESAQVIYSGGQDLLFLINEILDLSKVEAGMMDVHHEEVSLGGLAGNLRQQFQGSAAAKNLDFSVVLAADLPTAIVTDGQRLNQILRNLLSNALKFTAQGAVSLKIARPDSGTRFTRDGLTHENTLAFAVHDTGPGIPPEKRDVIFEAFRQLDGSTSRQYGGTGLGLSISRALARLLGAEIQLQTEQGKGSIFTVFLPFERRSAPADSGISPTVPESPMQRRSIKPERPSSQAPFLPDDRKEILEGDRTVLIIEDDARFSKILIERARERGFKCLAAGDGGSGLQLAADYKPKAIILDLALPDIDGVTVLDELKRNLATRHIPVHVLSARDSTHEVMQRGAIGYLRKPVDVDGINATFGKIENMLGNTVKNVLVVEDDDNSRKAIEKLLSAGNVRITGAASGGEAFERIAEGGFDCVVLDLGLPDMAGSELLERLSRNPSISLPPTIIYTGREMSKDELRDLGQYTTNVVLKGAHSPERLLDEVSLFLHLIESSLPTEQRRVLRMLHNPEQLLKGRKVLLVDDDLRNSFALSKVLKTAGLNVVLAENGKAALAELDKDAGIELVLMDIMMPEMDGYEAMSKIREQARFKNLPIVALTAKAMVEDRAKCIAAGANDYLAKPIDIDKMFSLIKVLLYQ